MPADTPMVLVPRGLLERVLSYAPSRGPLAFDVMEALSASATSTAEQAPPSPGEGDAPVAWRFMLDGGWQYSAIDPRPHISGSVEPLFTRPTPATPEGLRSPSDEALVAAMIQMAERAAEREEPGFWRDRARQHVANMRARPITDPEVQTALAEARLFLAALQPQAGEGE